jgi:hypothetical protein
MAQTPQSGESGGAGGTTAPGAGGPQGLFGSSTTILLVIFAVAVFWWSRRRRVEMEERLRAQRREAEATAERSALDVAHLMRAAPQSGAAAAAAREGLASAARPPAAGPTEPPASVDTSTTVDVDVADRAQTPLSIVDHDADARAMERAEARAAAERAAEEEAERAARDAEATGESVVRRTAAAEAAAGEAAVDTAEAERTGSIGATPDVGAGERQAGMRMRDSDAAVQMGAIAGDGTANCPPDFPIKGNRQSRIYHRPGQSSYASTVAEFCFASEEAAEAAGYRASRSRGERPQP